MSELSRRRRTPTPPERTWSCRHCGELFTRSTKRSDTTSRRYCDACRPKTRGEWNRMVRYGISPSQFAAMLEDQNGVCGICERAFEATVGRQKRGTVTLAVDHDHATDKVRGLLCDPCNRLLGLLENGMLVDNFVERARGYLKGSK
jgi:hypothetical protein